MRLVKPEERGCTRIRSWLRGGVKEREHTRVHEDALPSRHGVCATDGVLRAEDGADVVGRAARLVVQLEPGLLGHVGEDCLRSVSVS